ncbi:methyltransferase domain-containing protein [Streptacidiphilus sp. EB129]|uniref:methyltransferase domain-containing protein n=1 Tax=Streptacidiphilus sp. EB129 TaxID=3156262 RepID=UPI0035142CDF
MPATAWDPDQYLRHADHRSRPFHDLVDRIRQTPARVVDLGCGPGNTTVTLTGRWPGAVVSGIDNSAAMIDQARRDHPQVDFRLGDITGYDPAADGHPDLILSNAALQWVPGHADLLPRWADALPSGGTLAFQVPGNFGEPTHTLLADLRNSPRWAGRLGDGPDLATVQRPAVHEPADYLRQLLALGLDTDVWETTYYQVLPGPDPVLDWMMGTGLRPVLGLLTDPAERAAFLAEYGALLAAAYPAGPHGTVLPYRRIFVVATKP